MSLLVWPTSAANVDLIAHAMYLGQQRPHDDERFLLAVEECFELLAEMPHIGSVYESAHPSLQDVRIWRIKGFEKFLVFYRPLADCIEVIRILHGARDIAAVFEEDV